VIVFCLSSLFFLFFGSKSGRGRLFFLFYLFILLYFIFYFLNIKLYFFIDRIKIDPNITTKLGSKDLKVPSNNPQNTRRNFF
jgi:hypothetical protein